jgi:hypothetical protein
VRAILTSVPGCAAVQEAVVKAERAKDMSVEEMQEHTVKVVEELHVEEEKHIEETRTTHVEDLGAPPPSGAARAGGKSTR